MAAVITRIDWQFAVQTSDAGHGAGTYFVSSHMRRCEREVQWRQDRSPANSAGLPVGKPCPAAERCLSVIGISRRFLSAAIRCRACMRNLCSIYE